MKKLLYPTLAILMAASCKNEAPQQQSGATTTTTTVQTTAPTKQLPVILLVTTDASLEAEEGEPYDYPKTFEVPENTSPELAAYGVARNVWLGPKGWTGDGLAATNNGRRVNLYPKDGEKLDGPHVVYSSESSCIGCMVMDAAIYFPGAMADYKENYSGDDPDPLPTPKGLTIQQVSPYIVTFTLPDSNGLSTHGAVYYRNDSVETYFVEATFVLPPQQVELSNALTKEFIARMSSDK